MPNLADLIRFDSHELLATEFPFIVPLPGTWDDELGEPHWLAGCAACARAGAEVPARLGRLLEDAGHRVGGVTVQGVG